MVNCGRPQRPGQASVDIPIDQEAIRQRTATGLFRTAPGRGATAAVGDGRLIVAGAPATRLTLRILPALAVLPTLAVLPLPVLPLLAIRPGTAILPRRAI